MTDKAILIFTCAALYGCSGLTNQHLDPGGQAILQNVTSAPSTSTSAPATVSRTAGLAAVISAAISTRSVSVNNGTGACVTEQFPSGFQSGTTQYQFTFVAIPNASVNCSQVIVFTIDGILVTFNVIVP